MRHRIPLLIIGLAMFLLVTMSLGEPNRLQAESPARLEIAAFASATPGGPWPDGWKPLTFPKIPQHTNYSLVKDGERIVVKAASQASSSGLTREVRIDPKEYPIIR